MNNLDKINDDLSNPLITKQDTLICTLTKHIKHDKTMKIWKNLSNDVAQNLKIIKSRKLNFF